MSVKIDGGSKHVKRVGRVATAVALLLATLVGAVAVVAAPASAQEYGAVCSVAAAYDAEAGVLRVVGTGLQPGFTTPIALDGETIGEATADADGNFEVFIEIELDVDDPVEGEVVTQAVYVIGIICNDDGDESSTTVTTGSRVVHVLEPATIDCAGNLRGFAQISRPGTEVTFTLDHTGEVLAVVESDASGRAAYAVVVDLPPGTYTVTARGDDGLGDPFTLTSSFTVPTGCDDLVRTGTESMPLALTGLAAIALGSLTLLIARRRGAQAS